MADSYNGGSVLFFRSGNSVMGGSWRNTGETNTGEKNIGETV